MQDDLNRNSGDRNGMHVEKCIIPQPNRSRLPLVSGVLQLLIFLLELIKKCLSFEINKYKLCEYLSHFIFFRKTWYDVYSYVNILPGFPDEKPTNLFKPKTLCFLHIEELFFFNFPLSCILVLGSHVNVMLSLKQMLFRNQALIHFIEALWR